MLAFNYDKLILNSAAEVLNFSIKIHVEKNEINKKRSRFSHLPNTLNCDISLIQHVANATWAQIEFNLKPVS